MTSPLRLRIAFELPETAARLERAAGALGLAVVSSGPLASELAKPGETDLLLVEHRTLPEALVPRVLSLTGSQPDTLVVVVVPAPRAGVEAALLAAGAFDVLDDGSELATQLARTVAAARRVAGLRAERETLQRDLAQRDKLAALGLLSAGVSHEVNNPCGAILANLSSLRSDLEALMSRPRVQRLEVLDERGPDWLEAVGDCVSAAHRIHNIARSLNVFSRRSGEGTVGPVDLNEEIGVVVRLVGKEVRSRATFDIELAPGLPAIEALPYMAAQVLTNLVVNALQAVEAVPAGRGKVRITTGYDAEAVMISVEDNGPGIAPEHIGNIFDPFFTTKGAGGGTGLGLSITRSLVHKAGGEIFVDSEPGRGACFRVVFPRLVHARAPQRGRPSQPPAQGRLRVLILDDDELMLRSFERLLSAHFDCILARGVAQALAALSRDAHVDAVLADVVMPGQSGVDLWEQLRLTHPALAARTLFVSGGLTSERLRERVAATRRPLLDKPIERQALVAAIQALAFEWPQA
ncbi:MAG: response regulator [Polyangiaceae bacterium]|nr:response regulator [Polyangiaceae bacterium]